MQAREGHSVILAGLRGAFILLLAFAILPPFIPIFGPLSFDDVPPLLGIALALAVLPFSRSRLRVDATLLAFLLLGFLGIISSAANAESLPDFARLLARSTGRVLFFSLLTSCVRFVLERDAWPRRALVAIAAAATLESLFCLYAHQTRYVGPYGIGVTGFADWSVLKGHVRVQGTFSGATNEFELAAVSANFLAAYLVMTVPVTIAVGLSTPNSRQRLSFFIGAAAQVIALYLTYTRAALIALGAGILVMGWLLGKRRIAMTAIVLGVALALGMPSMRAKFFGESHDRYALYWASLAITRDHAVFGVGDGNYESVLFAHQRYHRTPYGPAVTASHNSILLSAAHHGVAGGLAQGLLYLLVACVGLRAVRATRGAERWLAAGVMAGIAGYLVQDQFNNLAYVPKVATQMWFLFGILTLFEAKRRPWRGGSAPPPRDAPEHGAER